MADVYACEMKLTKTEWYLGVDRRKRIDVLRNGSVNVLLNKIGGALKYCVYFIWAVALRRAILAFENSA